MDTEALSVQPLTVTQTVTKIVMTIPSFVLHATEMDVYVNYYTSDSRFIENHVVHVPPDIYKDWGTDDTVIENYVLQQLKLVRSSP